MGRTLLWVLVVALVVIAAALYRRHALPYNGGWSIPVRVHLLRSRDLEAANCQIIPDETRHIFSRVNEIWAPAQIHFEIESIVEEEATNASPGLLEGESVSLAQVQRLRPVASLSDNAIHVYYLHRLASNGVFQGLDGIYVQDTAQLRPVPGGIDTPLPRVTAHELGHALGLFHREEMTNLMASGTTGLSLNEAEIFTARCAVATFPFARKLSDTP